MVVFSGIRVKTSVQNVFFFKLRNEFVHKVEKRDVCLMINTIHGACTRTRG